MKQMQSASVASAPLARAGSRTSSWRSSLAHDDLLTTGEAAQILHVTGQTIRNLVRRGELHAVRVGHVFRLPYSDVMRYLRRRSRRP